MTSIRTSAQLHRRHKGGVLVLWRGIGPLLLLGGAMSGCAGLPFDSDVSRAVDIQRVDSSSAQIASVRVRDQDGGLKVSGRLQKRHAGRSPISGHLHIEALDQQGVVLGQATTSSHRLNPKLGSSYFSELLAVRIEDVRTLRVVHHRDAAVESTGNPGPREEEDNRGSSNPIPASARTAGQPARLPWVGLTWALNSKGRPRRWS